MGINQHIHYSQKNNDNDNNDNDNDNNDDDNEQVILSDKVIILNINNFQYQISLGYTLVYFQSLQCQHCKQFAITYSLLAQHYSHLHPQKTSTDKSIQTPQIKFSKLAFSPVTQPIFKRLNIDSTPLVRLYCHGLSKYYEWKNIEYDDVVIQNMEEWIHRVVSWDRSQQVRVMLDNQIEEISQAKSNIIKKSNIDKYSHRVVVYNCDAVDMNFQFKLFLNKIYLHHLDHYFYCLKHKTQLLKPLELQVYQIKKNINDISQQPIQQHEEQHIQKHEQQKYIHDIVQSMTKQQENIQLRLLSRIDLQQPIRYTMLVPKNGIQLLYQYQQHFTRYLTSQVIEWSLSTIYKTFIQHQPGFILLINNESKSHQCFQLYKQLKHQLHSNLSLYSPYFYYSDLSETPQQSTKIKRYVIGVEMGLSKRYLYPVLAYLRYQQGKVRKYLFPLNRELIKKNMWQWVIDVIKKLEIQSEMNMNGDDGEEENIQNINNEQHKQPKQPKQSIPSRIQVQQYFINSPQSAFPKVNIPSQWLPQHFLPTYSLQMINYEDFKLMLSIKYQVQFFVYINWRNDMKSYTLLREAKKWWDLGKKYRKQDKENRENNNEDNDQKNNKIDQEKKQDNKQQDKQDKQNKQNEYNNQNKQSPKIHKNIKTDHHAYNIYPSFVNIWILNLNINDYPRRYTDIHDYPHNILIEYIPTLLYFSKDKTVMNKIQGVQNISQIKQFIKENVRVNQEKNKIKQKDEDNKGNYNNQDEELLLMNSQNKDEIKEKML